MRSSPVSPAFTLVELLVVLAILALLAGILLPVMARARDAARAAACISNAHQIGSALLIYTQDYEGGLPLQHPVVQTPFTVPDGEAQTTITGSWPESLQSYLRSSTVWQCPSDTGVADGVHSASYLPNGYLTYGAFMDQTTRSEETILLTEAANGSLAVDVAPWLGEEIVREDIGTRHFGRANCLFADGHVQSLTEKATLYPIDHYLPWR